MRRMLILTAAVVAAVIFFVLATLPPRPARVDLSAANADVLERTVAGAYHIHTNRSDGAEDKASVAGAAKRAGLQFAIFTDHGDGTRPPDAPAYIDGVLCLDGVEISSNGGHYVALDMPAAPYPLGGEAAAVVEDVARLGGFGIVAHPDSAKPELSWRDERAPFDGIEWISIDTEWRDETRLALATALEHYAIRPAPAIASILDRPEATLARWTRALRDRPVVALASVDAHGRSRGTEGARAGVSYEAGFRALTNRVVLERPFSGDAAGDATLLMAAIRRGRVYTVVDAIASPAFFDFAAAPAWAGPDGSRLQRVGGGGNVVWYEVQVPGAPGTPPVPWLLANPAAFPPAPAPRESLAPRSGGRAVEGEWRVEKDPTSRASVARDGDGGVTFTYSLGAGPRSSQFAAIAVDVNHDAPATDVVFDVRADGPMRLSVQLRLRGTDERWMKSVYVDSHGRRVVVPVTEMVPAEGLPRRMPDAARARSLLFVVDLTNAVPGASGTIRLEDVRLLTAAPADR